LLLFPGARASCVLTYWTPTTVWMAGDSRAATPAGERLPDVRKIIRRGRFLIGVTGEIQAPGYDLLQIMAAAPGATSAALSTAILAAAQGHPLTLIVASFEQGRPVVYQNGRQLPGASGYAATGITAAIDGLIAPMLSRDRETALPRLIQIQAAADPVFVGGAVQVLKMGE
jgi:hypothetical protein